MGIAIASFQTLGTCSTFRDPFKIYSQYKTRAQLVSSGPKGATCFFSFWLMKRLQLSLCDSISRPKSKVGGNCWRDLFIPWWKKTSQPDLHFCHIKAHFANFKPTLRLMTAKVKRGRETVHWLPWLVERRWENLDCDKNVELPSDYRAGPGECSILSLLLTLQFPKSPKCSKDNNKEVRVGLASCFTHSGLNQVLLSKLSSSANKGSKNESQF